MRRKPVTYADTGVDVARGEQVVHNMRDTIRSTWNDKVIAGRSGFQALYDEGDHYLVGASDGVGTKLLVAIQAGKLDTIGQDLVAMVANDIVRIGAAPLFFLDYMATGKLTEEMHLEIIKGIAEGCRMAGMPLIGGETAELPGMYRPGDFDLAGFGVGRISKRRYEKVNGGYIRPGEVLVGIESSGLHSNGYSLARKVFFDVLQLGIYDSVEELDSTVAEALLKPTHVYVRTVLDILDQFPGKISGMAHITGGGIPNKLSKVLPEGFGAVIEAGTWPIHPIFQYIQEKGPVDIQEMRETFNMGIGMVMVVNDAGIIPDLTSRLWEQHKMRGYPIGRVIDRPGIHYQENIPFS